MGIDSAHRHSRAYQPGLSHKQESTMTFLIFWIGLSFIVGLLAFNYRGRSCGGWFLVSLLISPLLAGLLVLVLPDLRQALNAQIEALHRRKCPYCAEQIRREAVVCRYCGHDVEPEAPVTLALPVTEVSEKSQAGFWTALGCLAAISLGLVMLAVFFGH
jgi:hypothetical protein